MRGKVNFRDKKRVQQDEKNPRRTELVRNLLEQEWPKDFYIQDELISVLSCLLWCSLPHCLGSITPNVGKNVERQEFLNKVERLEISTTATESNLATAHSVDDAHSSWLSYPISAATHTMKVSHIFHKKQHTRTFIILAGFGVRDLD